MNVDDYLVMVDGKPVMTQQAVWEMIVSLQNTGDRARTVAKIAVVFSLVSLAASGWLVWMMLQGLA